MLEENSVNLNLGSKCTCNVLYVIVYLCVVSFGLVLSCLVLSCLIVSCLILSCVLSCLILPYLVSSCLILSCLIWSCLIVSCLVFFCRGCFFVWPVARSGISELDGPWVAHSTQSLTLDAFVRLHPGSGSGSVVVLVLSAKDAGFLPCGRSSTYLCLRRFSPSAETRVLLAREAMLLFVVPFHPTSHPIPSHPILSRLLPSVLFGSCLVVSSCVLLTIARDRSTVRPPITFPFLFFFCCCSLCLWPNSQVHVKTRPTSQPGG